MRFTHLDDAGAARMVDVTSKQPTVREATATGLVTRSAAVIDALRSGTVPAGDALAVAAGGHRRRQEGAGPAAAGARDRRPRVVLDLAVVDAGVAITATVRTADRTGVEMEALTAVTVAALAIVDMVKGVDRSAAISDCRIVAKSGGRSGDWTR
ncbi:MAG: cyclic pyranopterin monophosphate synthase MoaC [Micropruina sp.]